MNESALVDCAKRCHKVDQENKHGRLIGAKQNPPSQIYLGYGHLDYKTEPYGAQDGSFLGIGAELLRVQAGSSTPPRCT